MTHQPDDPGPDKTETDDFSLATAGNDIAEHLPLWAYAMPAFAAAIALGTIVYTLWH